MTGIAAERAALPAGADTRMRLDVWLWRARFYKSRSQAADAAASGMIRIERDGQVRRAEKASVSVAAGDLVSLPARDGLRSVRIVSLPERRGPAAEAAATYEPAGEAADGRGRAE